MNLDIPMPESSVERAAKLLGDAGFNASPDLCRTSCPRSISWWLGGNSAQKRRTVLELLELVVEPD